MKQPRIPVQPFPADAKLSPRRRHQPVVDSTAVPGAGQAAVSEPQHNRAMLALAAAVVLLFGGLGWWAVYGPGSRSATARIPLPEARPLEYPGDRLPTVDPSGPAGDILASTAPDSAGLADPAGLAGPAPQDVLPTVDGPVLAAAPGASPPVAAPDTKPARRGGSPVLIFDSGDSASQEQAGAAGIVLRTAPRPATSPTPPAASRGDARAMLTRGTLIPAVLESAIDGKIPGGVRAVVTTDVRSYDGKRVLIPRSSKLAGQYRTSGVGANARTYVIWTRIDRPDGNTVTLGGVAGKTDRSFLDSFGSAKVQSIVGGGGADRARTGEPIRVYAAGDVEVAKGP